MLSVDLLRTLPTPEAGAIRKRFATRADRIDTATPSASYDVCAMRSWFLTLILVLAAGLAVPGAAPAATGFITTIAGNGTTGFTGDGGLATGAGLYDPLGVTPTPDGGYLIADQAHDAIRRISADGIITTIAGNGTAGYSGDGGPALDAEMNAPSSAAELTNGSIVIADSNNNVIRRVSPDGTMSTVAGTGAASFSGDGGPATQGTLAFPTQVAATSDGGYLINDDDNDSIRKVSAAGVITTVVGSGHAGYSGDGGPPGAATLWKNSSFAIAPDGAMYIADTYNDVIREVTADGSAITTVAGTGTAGFGGDGGAARNAMLNWPSGVVALGDGGFAITDRLNNRIRRVAADGTISTIAGDGTAGYTGDGGPASSAELDQPIAMALASDGDIVFTDTFNHRVRRIDIGDPSAPAAPTGPTGTTGTPAPPTPAQPVAHLSVSPLPTCVGSPTVLDASSSRQGMGGPIVSYTFTYGETVENGTTVTESLASGAIPIRTVVFPWGRLSSSTTSSGRAASSIPTGRPSISSVGLTYPSTIPAGAVPQAWLRDPVTVSLTVTDASGHTARATEPVTFAQTVSTAARTGCPDAPPTSTVPAQSPVGVVVASSLNGFTGYIPCIGAIVRAVGGRGGSCVGTITAVTISSAFAQQLSSEESQETQDEAKVQKLKAEIAIAETDTKSAEAALQDAEDAVKQARDEVTSLLDALAAAYEQTSFTRARAVAAKASRPRPKAKAKRPKVRRITVFGRSRYQIPAGKKGTVAVTLSRTARKILKRYGVLYVRVITTSISPNGKTSTKSRTVKLTKPRTRSTAARRRSAAGGRDGRGAGFAPARLQGTSPRV
jgi:hypothetical protein